MAAVAAVPTVKVGQDLQYAKGFAITPSDTIDFPVMTQAIHCNVAGGNIVVVWEDNTTSTLVMLVGHTYRLKVRRVNNSGTTGTYVGLY
jgi:hypothetical protein